MKARKTCTVVESFASNARINLSCTLSANGIQTDEIIISFRIVHKRNNRATGC